MKTGCLRKADVLLCRRVSKSMKEAIDEELLKQEPEWLVNKTVFLYSDDVENFVVRAREFIKDGNVSTLLSKSVKIFVNTTLPFSVAQKLLQEHGKWIRHLKFNFFLIDERLDASWWMEMLIACLNFAPSLEFLGLVYDRHDDNEDEQEENAEVMNWIVLACWNSLVPPPVSHFPPLKLLTKIFIDIDIDDFELTPPTNFFNPIFAAYGSQVSELSYQPNVLYQVEGAMVLNHYFNNLKELELSGDDHIDMWSNIGQLNLQQLTKLEIRGIEMEVREIAPILQRHCSSLEELYLGTFSSNEVRNPQVWSNVVFSKLKRLTLCAEDVIAFWMNWYFLERASFPILEEIRVRSLSPCNAGEDVVALIPIPKLRNPAFDRLPMLKIVTFQDI